MTEDTSGSAKARAAKAIARMKSRWGKAQLRKNVQAVFEQTMQTEVGVLFDAAAITRLVEHLSSEPVLTRTVRPIVRASMMLELARLREDPEKLAAYVSDEAKALVDQLAERPNLLPEKFARKMLEHRAFEEIARDVLDDALKEFSEKVDPFKAEWGIPSLLKLGGPIAFGLGAFAKAFETVRDEFQKRLGPERKRFLQVFARKAIEMTAEFVIKRNDEPQFVALRKELFAWLLEQPVSELVAPASEPVTELTEKIGHAITKHVAGMEATKRRRRAQIEMILGAHKKQTLAQALATYGASIEPDFDALTEVLWPLIVPALDTQAVHTFFEELLADEDEDADEA